MSAGSMRWCFARDSTDFNSNLCSALQGVRMSNFELADRGIHYAATPFQRVELRMVFLAFLAIPTYLLRSTNAVLVRGVGHFE